VNAEIIHDLIHKQQGFFICLALFVRFHASFHVLIVDMVLRIYKYVRNIRPVSGEHGVSQIEIIKYTQSKAKDCRKKDTSFRYTGTQGFFVILHVNLPPENSSTSWSDRV
jgi:hypothetical protein